MENVLLVVHILACIALICVVLLQRSEGGALGIGGGGGGGLMSGRGATSALTKVTMGIAALFFVTSLVLTTLAQRGNEAQQSIAEEIVDEEASDLDATAPSASDDLSAPVEDLETTPSTAGDDSDDL